MRRPRCGFVILILCFSTLTLSSCLARRRVITRTSTVNKSVSSTTKLKTATRESLLARVSNLYRLVETLNATVDMTPALGSVNTGKITEYKDIRAYILFRKLADIRIIGLYPVVRNKAFDMTSNGKDFALYIPAKNRFVQGKNEIVTPSPNKIENLRPQAFLEALLIRPPAPGDITLSEDLTDEQNAEYLLLVLGKDGAGNPFIERNIWFDRLSLNIARQTIFDPQGEIVSDTRYSDWSVVDGVPFPKKIDLNRPKDGYGVVMALVKADINKPLTDDKFALKQPEGTQLQILGQKPGEAPPPAATAKQ